MDRDERILKLKLDIIFKRIFGNAENEDIIKTFIEDLLELPQKSIQSIYIDNVELVPAYLDMKFRRLDLRMKIDDRIVNIEMQVNNEPDFSNRTLYYWSRLFSDDLKAGDEYGQLRQTICINIINFNHFTCNEYHSHFQLMEKERHEILSDRLSIHFFELRKIGKNWKNKRMEDWLNLINAETEGELMDIQNATNIPEVKKTIVKLRELSEDEQLRVQAFYREKRLHDEATALGTARREGFEEGRAEGEKTGILRAYADLVRERVISLTEAAKRVGMTEKEFMLQAGLERIEN